MGFLKRRPVPETPQPPEARHLRIVRPEDERQAAWDLIGLTEEQKLSFLTVHPDSAEERLLQLEDAKTALEPFLSDQAIGRWFSSRMADLRHERPTAILGQPDGPARIKLAAEGYVRAHYEEPGRIPDVA